MLQKTPAHELVSAVAPPSDEQSTAGDRLIVRRNRVIRLSKSEADEVRRWEKAFCLLYGVVAFIALVAVWIAV
jgi:hypothetical protein